MSEGATFRRCLLSPCLILISSRPTPAQFSSFLRCLFWILFRSLCYFLIYHPMYHSHSFVPLTQQSTTGCKHVGTDAFRVHKKIQQHSWHDKTLISFGLFLWTEVVHKIKGKKRHVHLPSMWTAVGNCRKQSYLFCVWIRPIFCRSEFSSGFSVEMHLAWQCLWGGACQAVMLLMKSHARRPKCWLSGEVRKGLFVHCPPAKMMARVLCQGHIWGREILTNIQYSCLEIGSN